MKFSALNRRIEDLVEKLEPEASDGIRIDFYSFTLAEQLVILKNHELEEICCGRWTNKVVLENKELILKFNEIVIRRMIELFIFCMPKALMLDEHEECLFKVHFCNFLQGWMDSRENLSECLRGQVKHSWTSNKIDAKKVEK